MAKNKMPVAPVKPVGLEFLFIYACPFCRQQHSIIPFTRPATMRCDQCRKQFPIIPVDGKTLAYLKFMLANGKACIDPDFV